MFVRSQIKLAQTKISVDAFGVGKSIKYLDFFLIVVDRILCAIKYDLVKPYHAGRCAIQYVCGIAFKITGWYEIDVNDQGRPMDMLQQWFIVLVRIVFNKIKLRGVEVITPM